MKDKRATFAGGCFWCMEPPFNQIEGVISITSGYTGGEGANPTYEDVGTGKTGHAEAVDVVYDPEKISYQELLEIFWKNIDPSTKDRQFCDIGSQYRTAIFTRDEEQLRLAKESKQRLIHSGRFSHVFTEIVPAGPFYPAEEYHQSYYKKNPLQYKCYRNSCKRDDLLAQLWKP